MASIHAAISAEALDVADLISHASSPSCGAVASFVGTVRETSSVDETSGTPVTHLDYDAHPQLAENKLREIATQASEKWPLETVVAVHRTGTCALGEPTVVIACGSAHRTEALEACHWVIDEVKASVPIWKKEIYSDGSSWVGVEPGA